MENSLLIMPPLAWPSSAAAPRCSADLMQHKREQCRDTVCERSDVKPLDSAEPLGLLSPSFLLAWPQTRSAALLSPAGVLAAATPQLQWLC